MPDSLDTFDLKLIVELQRDGRQSNAKLAQKLSVSEATVRRRIQRLRQAGVITITAVPDPFKVGYGTVANIGLQVQMGRVASVASALADKPYVHYVALTTGRYDMVVWVVLRTSAELANFLTEELSLIDGIVRTETMVNLEIHKRSFGWLCLPSESP